MFKKGIIFILAAIWIVSGCGKAPTVGIQPVASPDSATLMVLAAASLTEPFGELGRLFEDRHPGVQVSFSFAGSQQLAQQLGDGAKADVFASASPKYMDAAETSGRVEADSVKELVRNRLVIITPKANQAGVETIGDLGKMGLKLVMAAEGVPVGKYALDFLDRANGSPGTGGNFKEKVLRNVVSYEDNVKSILAKVVLDEADAGIVYQSDVSQSSGDQVKVIEIPDEWNVIASYPIASIRDSSNAKLAEEFIALALSPEGQAIFSRYGFVPPAGIPEVTPP